MSKDTKHLTITSLVSYHILSVLVSQIPFRIFSILTMKKLLKLSVKSLVEKDFLSESS